MNLQALKTELAKPEYADAIAAGDHAGLAATINAKTVSVMRPVSSAALLAWSAANGRYRKIEAATADPTAAFYSLASTALLLIRRDATELDLNLADRVAMLGALVAYGVLAQADADAIYTLATHTIPWTQSVGLGGEVGRGQIINALREMGVQ
jgi:hypothetical protein